jgi:hypothetical protein
MTRHASRNRQVPDCGDPCRWRSLYEGSQTSLSDMAGKQASVIGDHDRMRGRVVMLLKRTWPVEFGEAERALGHRLGDATDEVLLAYLEAWTIASATAVPTTAPAGVDALRSTLRDLGLAVPDHGDLNAWSAGLRRAAAEAALEPPADSAGPVSGDAPRTAGGGLSGRAGLHDLFDDAPDPDAGTQTPPHGHAGAPHAGSGFDDLFDDEGPAGGFADLFDDAPPSELGGIFDDEPSSSTAQAQGLTTPPAPETVEDLGDLFDDGPANMADVIDRAVHPGVSDHTAPHHTAPRHTAPRHTAPHHGAATAVAAPEPPPTSEPVPTGPPAPAPAGTAGAVVVKPELFPGAKSGSRKRTGARKTRSRAAGPDLDVPGGAASSTVVADDTRSALLAAVAIPRPVFVADLAAVAGSREAAEAWEAEMRRQGLTAPVRLIAGKPRHRLRGTLVLPAGELREAANAFNVGWWADAMGAYSGARMYEMAVLLHRVGDDIVSATFDEDVAKLRLKQSRGLVGVVVATSSDLGVGEETRGKIADAVAELIAERLTLVAVLAIRAEDRAALVTALEGESAERGWRPAVPVVVAQSWEWADDAGSSATLVLGG